MNEIDQAVVEYTDNMIRKDPASVYPGVSLLEQAKIRAGSIRALLLPHGIVMADVFHPGYLKVAGVSEEQMAEWILEAEVPEFPPGRPMASLEELAGSRAPQEALCAAE